MGVKKYQSWVRKQFSGLVRAKLYELIGDIAVRRLFFDLNALIHFAIDEVYGTQDTFVRKKMTEESASFWKDIVEALHDELIYIILMTRPVYLVYLGADGAVSKAKILQQRQRTYKSTPGTELFNRNNVKPGTEFMSYLGTELRSRLVKSLKSFESIVAVYLEKSAKNPNNEELAQIAEALKNFKYKGPLKAKFSDSSQKGEGEHKIIKEMRETGPKSDYEFPKMVDVIFSPDSDMHILTMLNSRENDRVVIMRHKHKDKKKREELDKSQKYEFFYVTKIKEELYRQGIRDMTDWSIIACFGGNDFVPGLSHLKYGDGDTFEIIKSAYLSAFGRNQIYGVLFKDGTISWTNLVIYLRELTQKSRMSFQKMGELQINRPDLFYDETSGEDRRFSPLVNSLKLRQGPQTDPEEKYIFNSDLVDMEYVRYVSRTFHTVDKEDMDYNLLPEMCQNYLEGLLWVLEYYRQEKGVNQNWGYTFHYPPPPYDLLEFLEDNLEKLNEFGRENATLPWEIPPRLTTITVGEDIEDFEPFEPVEQLVAVLRKEDLSLLPKIVEMLFLEKMPSLYPEKVEVDYTFVRFGEEHDAVVLSNFPDMDRIRSLYSHVAKDKMVSSRNKGVQKVEIWSR